MVFCCECKYWFDGWCELNKELTVAGDCCFSGEYANDDA